MGKADGCLKGVGLGRPAALGYIAHDFAERRTRPPVRGGINKDGTRAQQESEGGGVQRTTCETYDTRAYRKIDSLANLLASRATCQPAAAARRSQAPRRAPHAECRFAPASTARPACPRGAIQRS